MKRSLRTAIFLCALILAPALLFSQADWSGKPVKLSIIDVAGNLRLSKPAIEAFKAANPKMISDIEYTIATAPELVAKIKAQQMAGNLDTTMVLTGYDGMAAGKEQGVWLQVMPKYRDVFQKSIDSYLPGARAAYNLFDGYGIAYVFCPGGPMFTYNPDTVKTPPGPRNSCWRGRRPTPASSSMQGPRTRVRDGPSSRGCRISSVTPTRKTPPPGQRRGRT